MIFLWIFTVTPPTLFLEVGLEMPREECQRAHGHLRMVVDKFHWVFSARLLHACGKDVQFCRPQRPITPLRCGLARTATWASPRVDTGADLHRGFHALLDTTSPAKAFYPQGAQPHVAACARLLTSRLIRDMTLQGLGGAKGRPLRKLRRILLQDGSACALHDGVREVWPGRGKTVQPAAVARPTPPGPALRCPHPRGLDAGDSQRTGVCTGAHVAPRPRARSRSQPPRLTL